MIRTTVHGLTKRRSGENVRGYLEAMSSNIHHNESTGICAIFKFSPTNFKSLRGREGRGNC